MSVIDEVTAAVTPPESDGARAKARAAAEHGDWLSIVLDHHQQAEAAFATVKAGGDALTRTISLKGLATRLTGHPGAEEAALYPALAGSHETGRATKAYTEQSAATTTRSP